MDQATHKLLIGALCAELHVGDDGQAPEWVHLLPLGPEVVGRDGRKWTLPSPEDFVRASQAELPAPFDYMHASERRRPDGTGDEAPAAGWIVELNVVRDGDERAPGIWGRVEWTPRGKRAVAEREYRFVSPAFLHRRTGEIERLTSAGLVHKPNLDLSALNHARGEEYVMTKEQLKALCLRLGLVEDASTDAIMARVGELDAAQKALNARGDVVPRADLETALNRAREAEAKLAEHAKVAFNARRDAVLEAAQRAGKIAPSSREYYAALCTSEEALRKTEQLLESLPALVSQETAAGNTASGDDLALNSRASRCLGRMLRLDAEARCRQRLRG